jgi:hypothetical protein
MIYKPHCHNQNFSPLANGLYLITTTNKTLKRNGNCPITDPITDIPCSKKNEDFHMISIFSM